MMYNSCVFIAEDMTKLESKFIDKRDFSYLKEHFSELATKVVSKV